MCRLLGVATSTPRPLAEQVPAVLSDFRELSHKHRDGWGAAWRDSRNKLQIRLNAEPAWSTEQYPSTIDEMVSDLALVHLRRASPGLPVLLENCHPFIDGEVAFEHNGQFPVSDRLLAWAKANGVRERLGSTDSEFFFGLILHHAERLPWPAAIAAAAQQITADLRLTDPADSPESLNLLLTTRDTLYAFAQSNPVRLPADALPNAYELRIRESESEVIVTSSQWDLPGASVIGQWQVVEVSRGSLNVTRHQFGPIAPVTELIA